MIFALLVMVFLGSCSGAMNARTASPRVTSSVKRVNAELAGQPNDVWRAHFIDVGQGLAVLQEFPCGAMLIDTGGEDDQRFNSDSALLAYLDGFFARRTDLHGTLDLVVLTHPHIDHTRGTEAVLDRYQVHNLVDNGQTYGSGAPGQQSLEAFAGSHPSVHYRAVALSDIASATGLTDAIIDPFRCQPVDPTITALWGRLDNDPGWPGMRFGKTPFQNNNNHSVVLRVAFGKASGLFTGDLEEPAIKDLLTRSRAAGLLDVDLYQVGHHGSINGTLPELAEAMSPEIAVFSMGPASWQLTWSAWKYGHPRQEIVQMLADVMVRKRKPIDVQVGIKSEVFTTAHIESALYATGWDGTVVVQANADGRLQVVTSGR
jgi:competence protein ComEC